MTITHNRQFSGIWIPAEIWLTDGLNALEKILLVEVNSLDNEMGCIAGNDYFAGFLGITTIRVSQMIKKLKDEGYIYEASFDGRVRTLKSNIKTIVKQSKDDYKTDLKKIIKQNEENVKPALKEIINNSNTVNNLFNNSSNKEKDTASGFSQNDFLENFIKERLSKMSESAKAGYYASTVTQLESLSEKLGRPLTKMECQERCKMILDKMYPEDENPTAKESLTVQKQKKGIQITKKEDIESFVRTFKASEFEVDGVVQLQSVFSENEIELITGYLLRRKEKHKSKAECSQQAIKVILNKILEIKGVHALEVVFEQHDGCYVNCGTAGDPTTPWIRLELEYFTKLIKKPTFNNQYAKSNTTPTTRDFLKCYEKQGTAFDPRSDIE